MHSTVPINLREGCDTTSVNSYTLVQPFPLKCNYNHFIWWGKHIFFLKVTFFSSKSCRTKMLHKSAHTYTQHSVASVLNEMKFKIASLPSMHLGNIGSFQSRLLPLLVTIPKFGALPLAFWLACCSCDSIHSCWILVMDSGVNQIAPLRCLVISVHVGVVTANMYLS